MDKLIQKVADKTWLTEKVIEAIIKLLDEWNTIPFIARYRKEVTGWASDEALRDFHEIYEYTKNLETRKEDVLRLIEEKWKLTSDLKERVLWAETLARVEDLYRPFKEKKNTRWAVAKLKWLEPLAGILKKADLSKEDFEKEASNFINIDVEEKLQVKDVEDAILWAKDIIAEEISDDADLREKIKWDEEKFWILKTKPTKTFEEKWEYKVYKEYSKKMMHIPSYAYLAIARAEKEKQLSVSLEMFFDKIFNNAKWLFVPKQANSSKIYLEEAIEDGLKRLMLPSIEREIRSDKKKTADIDAIKIFGENMKNLLLTPPIKGKTILGYDPGFRTGCKLAVVDPTWKFLDNSVVYPVPPQNKVKEWEREILRLIKKHNIDLIVIWNGTASRESERFISNLVKENKLDVKYMVVSEAWASVYSASKLGQEEYPDLDVTVRWAISIAHRVQDAMAELTKIDAKSIWVGQYQHDVDQKLLKSKLDDKIEDTVNSVWVDVNTASYTLLSSVSGLSLKLAKNIVDYRNENWEFTDKKQIKKVAGIWPKSYEQAVWFLRIKWWKEVLDQTWIHPETYKVAYEILKEEFGVDKKSLILPLALQYEDKLSQISIKYEIWEETLLDIFKELASPGLDPRDELDLPSFKSDVVEIEDLSIWDELEGIVRNVTDFWAFVDIWLHSDWLVHKSQLADRFVKDPMEVVSVWMKVSVKVVEVDVERERVGLSMKWLN